MPAAIEDNEVGEDGSHRFQRPLDVIETPATRRGAMLNPPGEDG
jgi:hypothetical protein